MTDANDDATLRHIFASSRVIAVVGMSDDPARPSHYVARYLAGFGYRIVPVNPLLAGTTLLGQEVWPDFAAIPVDLAVDMVDIFRRPEYVPGVVDAALAQLPQLRTIWMQMGIRHAGAAAAARAAGKLVVEDRCPKVEIPRLFGRTNPLAEAV